MYLLLSKICKILNDSNIIYLIIGGTAVAYHGYSRKTLLSNGEESDKYDFDIWYQPTIENYINIIKTLKYFDINFNDNDLSKFYVFRKEYDNYKLDLIPFLEFLDKKDNKKFFINFYNRRNISTINNINIHFINKEDLIYIKKLSNRPKVINDIKNLS